ncbi:MAG TPA: nitrogen fixation protein [Terriglobia bacterium]|nr:nitrogen fixation protein [Terriglobia bacterium]
MADQGRAFDGANHLLCPSAQPEMKGSTVLGVVDGAAGHPELAYLNQPLPVTEEVLRLAGPVKPTEVFRFAAHCEEKACRHFDGTRCQLATRIVQILPAVTEGLPACIIRPTCRWYQQEGKAACLRCPQVVTQTYEASDDYRRAAEG